MVPMGFDFQPDSLTAQLAGPCQQTENIQDCFVIRKEQRKNTYAVTALSNASPLMSNDARNLANPHYSHKDRVT
eukprot:1161558-Pelagomonas_calceolata.AAC.1